MDAPRRPTHRPTVRRAIAWAAYGVSIVALLFVLQAFHVGSVRTVVLDWPRVYPVLFLVNLAILALVFAGLHAVFNSAFYALAALTPLVLALGYADRAKLRVLDLPVLPSDLLFLRELASLEGYYGRLIGLGLVGIVVGALLLRRVRDRVPHLRVRPLPRVAMFVCVAGLLGYASSAPSTHAEGLNRTLGIRNIHWHPYQNYKLNGVLYGFFMYAESALVRAPPRYGRAEIDRLLGKYPPVAARDPARRPNVLVYMSESFWDIRNLPGVELGVEATPQYRALQESGYGFRLVTPAFGGNTCDPEFEFLTGLPVKYFPPGSRAFQQYVRRPLPSIARLFEAHGYHTAGLHTYHRWFWGRDRVYPLMGFDVFRGVEDMAGPEKKGDYFSDRMLTRVVLEETRRTDDPWFIYAISVQNHGPYGPNRYAKLDHDVPTTGLSEKAAAELRTYTQGLADADRSLQELVRFVDAQEEPTLLLFFGDHLPGADALFAETGFLREGLDPVEEARRRYLEGGVVHANFPIPPPRGKVLSPQFLSLYVAELAGLELPPFYGFLAELRDRLPGFSRNLVLDATGAVVPPDDARVRATDAEYWTIVYDVLFGANHGARYYPPVSPRVAAGSAGPADAAVGKR